ncbi:unnamed protein product [Adineta steineri]|uniref:Uncharacterized protein n=1 Tax=Adineta steineri TaxID=433720 RepID=A0A815DFM6_9BILA|nr:unnamed protein product [Adineta steineri]CAF1574306.1 unnamed protein product [Adineta steineri]
MEMAGSLIAFACGSRCPAMDGQQRNGLFTKHLLQHIKTPNEDIQLLLRAVRKAVVEESKYGQIPFVSDGLLEKNICLYGQSRYKLDGLIQIPNAELKLDEEIGKGGFGTVYRATWERTHYTVAVKTLHLIHLASNDKRAFEKELKILHNLRSPHIVTLFGACMEDGNYAMVIEYMSLGSLYKVLHEDKDTDKLTLEWPERWSIALQAAIGVNYLHQLSPAILHRDLKSANFLLERIYEGYSVKLCDFGVAQIRNATTRQTTGSTERPISLSWTAPEILDLEDHTEKSDIYSLGIVYWELFEYKIPYDGCTDGVIRQFVLAGKRLKNFEKTPSTFRTIIERCWAHNPSDRPDGSELIQMIKQCIPVETDILQHIFYDAACFVLKTRDEKNITLAKTKGIWITSQANQEKLNRAFQQHQNVILFLSVTGRKGFQGIARLSCESRDASEGIAWMFQTSKKHSSHAVKIDLIPCETLRFCHIDHLFNSLDKNKPVTLSSDGQEIDLDCAKALCRLFPSNPSIDIMPIVTKAISHIDFGFSANTSKLNENGIFISGLPSNMNKQLLFNTIQDMFSTVGQIKIDPLTEKSCIYLFRRKNNMDELTGGATVTFESLETVKKAFEKYNGSIL